MLSYELFFSYHYVIVLINPYLYHTSHHRFDLCAFDGASNVQKAGAILSTHFPRVTCIHGAEHVVSLFFDDVFKLEHFNVLVLLHNRLRNYFGSVRHAPAAMFKKHSKAHNNGIALCFIKIAETRMGGNIIALLRLLRLRDPLVACCHNCFK